MTTTTSSCAVGVLVAVAIAALSLSWAGAARGTPFGPEAGPSLCGVWSGRLGQPPLNMTTIDPATGQPVQMLFSSMEMGQLFLLDPAVDRQHKRLFLAAPGQFAKPGKIVLASMVPIPGNYFGGIQYDPVKDTVWVVSANIYDGGVPFLISVDMTSGKATNVTGLPEVPATFGLGGIPVTLDAKNRELIFSTMTKPGSGESSFSLTKFNLDSHRFTSIPLTKGIYPTAMVNDPESGTIYALFTPTGSPGGTNLTLSFGTVKAENGEFNVISKWTDPDLVFVVGTVVAYDHASAQLYTMLGNGRTPYVALVSVSSATGEIEKAVYYGESSPSPVGLFVL